MNKQKNRYAVIGAGSWGTALAMLLAHNGNPTVLWGRDTQQIAVMQRNRVNEKYLDGGAVFPSSLIVSSDLEVALKEVDVVLLAVPCRYFRDLLEQTSESLKRSKKLVWACKGLELETGALLNTVAQEVLGSSVQKAVISGPNFAIEVAKQMPSATTVAADSMAYAKEIALDLHNSWFRAYSTDDLVGVQLAGALKNGLAIACGIADGLGFGANTKAALLARGLQEITRLGLALGGEMQTFMGLAGVGDLMMTCTDNQSRNRRLGLLLAEGHSLDAARSKIGRAVEGIEMVQAVHLLAKRQALDLPILEQVNAVLYEDKSPMLAVQGLLARDQKNEV